MKQRRNQPISVKNANAQKALPITQINLSIDNYQINIKK
jgi:hypothetical protein